MNNEFNSHYERRKLIGMLCLMACITVSAQPVTEAWVRRYSQPRESTDVAVKVVTDNEGNAIVAGHSTDGGATAANFLVIKYSAVGLPLWTNRYDGPTHDDDFLSAMIVDNSGNVIVTGSSGGGDADDYATVKYSNAGVPLWTNRYNGPANGYDQPTAVAADADGNVFVTGLSLVVGAADYATIKYSAGGVPLWTNRYAGPGLNHDQARAVVVDSSGNVIVTGNSAGSNGDDDYATIKYSNSGVALWTNRYNGPGNDQAKAITVDSSGNIFVTGDSSANLNVDYATVAYSPAGTPLWTNRYNGSGNSTDRAAAIALDSSGNVLVTGQSIGVSSDWDYATIQYSNAGLPLWTNRYDAPAHYPDQANAIALDSSGNVIVSGYSSDVSSSWDYACVKYSSAGELLWTVRYNGTANDIDLPNAVAVDGNGNVFVTGQSWSGRSSDFATIKYSGAGVPLWTNRFNGTGNGDDEVSALAVDGSGNVFVTGSSWETSYADFATVAFSSAGVPLWTNRYDGPVNGADQVYAIAVDNSGNVFVTGLSQGFTESDYLTIKYSGNGVPLWTNRSGYPGGSSWPHALGTDNSGNAIVTGYDGGGAATTIKYSSAGIPLWTNRYDNGLYNDFGNDVVVDGSGSVIVTGGSYGVGNYDYFTIKYSSAGIPLWTNRYNGPGNHDDVALDVAVDGNGNIFVTGGSFDDVGEDYATIAYSSAGVPLWTNRYDGPGHGDDRANAIAVDSAGNVVVTGYSGVDYLTIKYSGAGVPLWTNRYTGPEEAGGSATAVAVDGVGNVVVTGAFFFSNSDYVTIAYSSAGVPLWTNRFNGPANGNDSPTTKCLAIDDKGVIYVAGTSDGSYSAFEVGDYAIVKYAVPALTQIPLNYQVVGKELVLSWTNTAFGLQSAPATQGVYTNIAGATSPFTNLISGAQKYFRLKAD